MKELNLFERDHNRDFRLVQNLTMRETDSNRSVHLGIPLVLAAENFGREENSLIVLIPTVFEDMDEQHKLAHKEIDLVDQAKTKVCVTLLRYNVEPLESSFSRVQFLAKKKEEKTLQKNVFVIYYLENLSIYFL